MRNNSNRMYAGLSAILLSAMGSAVVSWGCVNDERMSAGTTTSPGEITFMAMQNRETSMATRAEAIPVNPDDFGNTDFYIYETGTYVDKQANVTEQRAEVGVYWLASGVEGQLDYKGQEEEKLNWFAADTEHLFWSWTWPLAEKDYSKVNFDTKPKAEPLTFISSDFPLPEDPDHPRDLTPSEAWRNGEALEQLVGTMTERPYIFNEDGRFVPLTYKHLVSKIILGKFILVDNTGSQQNDLKARITFYGMPKRAMFYPVPAVDAAGNKVAPYVTIDYTDPYGINHKPDEITKEELIKAVPQEVDYDTKEYLTFYITNEGGDNTNTGTNPDADSNVHPDLFYICPEVDFTDLEYKVEFVEYDTDTKTYIPHTRYGNRGGYFGNFKSIQFKREVDGVEVVATDRKLHAGEIMMLNMTVYEKSGPGAGVYIRNWESNKLKSATHHVHKGIYSDAEAAAVRTTFQKTSDSDEVTDERRDSYAIYGEDEEDADRNTEHVIHLYSDVTLANTSGPFNFKMYYEVPPAADVILDGMGYTISFINNSSTNKVVFETFVIGNMRDVYITNGIGTVYIDPQGQICRMNEETGKYDPDPDSNPWTPNVTEIPFVKK